MNVLYAIGYAMRMAGSQRSLLELVSHLPRDIRPIVVTTVDGQVADAFRARGIAVTVLPIEGELGHYGRAIDRWSWPTKVSVALRQYLPYVIAARRLMRRLDVDLVHANDPRAALLFGAAARLARLPTVTHLRGEVAIPRVAWHAVELLSDRVITVSDALQAQLTARARARTATVYNGTRFLDAHLSPIPWLDGLRRQGIAVVTCFASIVPFKGYHHLVDAIAELNRRGWRDRAVFVGVGDDTAPKQQPYLAWLHARMRAAGVDNLTLAGWQEDPFRFYAVSDLTVLPSVSRETLDLDGERIEVLGNEGFPRTHLEAMAAGLPVVGTHIAGVPEQVEDGRTGFVVPPADPHALADAIEKLLQDPARRREMGEAGRARARRLFSIEACVDGVLATYRTLGVMGRA